MRDHFKSSVQFLHICLYVFKIFIETYFCKNTKDGFIPQITDQTKYINLRGY